MLESEWRYIKDRGEWEKFCSRLDNAGSPYSFNKALRDINPDTPIAEIPYLYKHIGEPMSYPCLVKVDLQDDPNGPFYYDHSFVYQDEMTYLLQMSLKDLIIECDRYKELAVEFLMEAKHLDKEEAEQVIDGRISNGN